MSQSTSLTLLQRLVKKDDAAWKIANHYYGGMVFNWCRSRGSVSREDAEEIANETLYKASQNISDFDRQRTGSFRNWLKVIALRVLADRARKARHESLPSPGGAEYQQLVESIEAASDESNSELDKEHLLKTIMSKLKRAEEKNVRAFIEILVCGRTPKDVAMELGMKHGSIRTLAVRIGTRLQNILDSPEELGDFFPPSDGDNESS